MFTPTAVLIADSVFPPTWGRIVLATYTVDFSRSGLADGGSPARHTGGLYFADRAENVTGPIGVKLGPVRGAQIASRNLMEDQSGVGLTPTVTWMAPAIGTAVSYRMVVTRIATGEFRSIYTPNTSVTLPPGLLVADQAYVFLIYGKEEQSRKRDAGSSGEPAGVDAESSLRRGPDRRGRRECQAADRRGPRRSPRGRRDFSLSQPAAGRAERWQAGGAGAAGADGRAG